MEISENFYLLLIINLVSPRPLHYFLLFLSSLLFTPPLLLFPPLLFIPFLPCFLILSSPQLGGAPSPSRTCFTSPQELRSLQQQASSLLPPSPSSTRSLPPHQESRRRADLRGRSRGTRGFSLKVSPAPNTSSCLSPPPTRPSKAPWSRPSATTCTSSPQRVRGVSENLQNVLWWFLH